jgi:hypothetical protein
MSQIRYFYHMPRILLHHTGNSYVTRRKQLYQLPETVISPLPSNPSRALIACFHIIVVRVRNSKFQFLRNVNKSSDEQISFSIYLRLMQTFELFDRWKEVHFLKLKCSQIIITVPLTNGIQWLSKLFFFK